MPIKFPNLKTTRDPIGLIEQFGAAVTVSPDEDAGMSATGSDTWFGRLLSDASFEWRFTTSSSPMTLVTTKAEAVAAYKADKFLFTVYDWQLTGLSITGDTGTATGTVIARGTNKLTTVTDFKGTFKVTYEMAREQVKEFNDDEGRVIKWRLRKWILQE